MIERIPLCPCRGVPAGALLLAAVLPLLGGCVPLLVGGAAVGVAAAHDRRGYTAVLEDQQIEFAAASALGSEPGLKDRARVSVVSYNGVVLLTGQARTASEVALAGEVVARLPKVRKVINEVSVGPDLDLTRISGDALLTSRAKLALFNISIPGFDPTRVKVSTENGVVYLMGLVTPAEGDAAAQEIRYVPGVARVVKLFEYAQPQNPSQTPSQTTARSSPPSAAQSPPEPLPEPSSEPEPED